MIFWNSEGTFFRPNDITFHSYCPKCTMKTILYLLDSCIWICQNPDFISNLENILAEFSLLSKSYLFRIIYIYIYIYTNTPWKKIKHTSQQINQKLYLTVLAFFKPYPKSKIKKFTQMYSKQDQRTNLDGRKWFPHSLS